MGKRLPRVTLPASTPARPSPRAPGDPARRASGGDAGAALAGAGAQAGRWRSPCASTRERFGASQASQGGGPARRARRPRAEPGGRDPGQARAALGEARAPHGATAQVGGEPCLRSFAGPFWPLCSRSWHFRRTPRRSITARPSWSWGAIEEVRAEELPPCPETEADSADGAVPLRIGPRGGSTPHGVPPRPEAGAAHRPLPAPPRGARAGGDARRALPGEARRRAVDRRRARGPGDLTRALRRRRGGSPAPGAGAGARVPRGAKSREAPPRRTPR